MSINETDKPTVTSMPEENVEKQLASLPQQQPPIPVQTVGTESVGDAVAPAVVLADIKPGHEIGAGATASDYAEAVASSNSTTQALADNTSPPSTYSTSYNIQPQPRSDSGDAAGDTQDNSNSLLISTYINNAVNEAQRQRVIKVVEDWVNNGNCDKAKLQEALQAETVKDSMHLLEIVVEIMSRIYRSSNIGNIVERKPGIIGIRIGARQGTMERAVRFFGMEDGSIRLSYINSDGSTVAQKPEDLFKDTPDADAETVVQAAMGWLVTKTF